MRVISGSARGTIIHSIEDESTRPTLDRVKESVFNIINKEIDEDTVALDLFAGSGAIGIEFLSRGAKETIFCDMSKEAINIIKQNLQKTKLQDKANIINKDYIKALKEISINSKKIDIIYIDPPYKENIAIDAVLNIDKLNLLNEDGIIIIETDEIERDVKEIEDSKIKYKIYDKRKYGRAYLIFLSRKG